MSGQILINELKNKKVGVVLSSGFFGFYSHTGFIKALEKVGIDPVAYSGTSAGAIIAAFKAAGMNTEQILKHFKKLKRKDFWDPGLSNSSNLLLGLKGFTGYLRGNRFRKLVDDALPKKKFKDLDKGLYIVATNLTKNRKEVFSKGSIATAVQASGAVPFLFKSVEIKDNHFVDGGMLDKAPIKVLAENEDLDHIILNYLPSKSIKREPNWFLEKRLTPMHIFRHSYNILRHQEFLMQHKWVTDQGVKITMVVPKIPSQGPFKLESGVDALDLTYHETLKVLKNNGKSKMARQILEME